MDRRSFGRKILGIGAAAIGAVGCQANRTQNQTASQNRAADGLSVKPFELDEVTIADLQAGMQSGKYTARSITEAYLSRIESTNKKGPALFACSKPIRTHLRSLINLMLSVNQKAFGAHSMAFLSC